MANHNVENLASLIFTAGRLIRERTVNHGKLDLLSFVHLKILALIAEKDFVAMKEIAGLLHVTPPSTTATINRLVKSGQLQKRFDKKDRRIVRLKITSKGRKTLVLRRQEVEKRLSGILNVLDSKEKKEFSNILKKIINYHQYK